MTSVDFCYKLMLYILNKNQTGGNLSPADFNRTFNQAQVSYTSYLLGSVQQYTPGKPVARVELGENSVVRQRITPIIYGYILNVDQTGFAPYPADYIQTDAMWSIYGYKRVRYYDNDKWYSAYNSSIDTPTTNNAIYRLRDEGFEFAPANVVQTKMSYVRNPPDVVWGYVLDTNNRPVYDPARSVDPVWDSVSILDIIGRALAMCGVNLQFGMVEQYAQELKNTGQ